MFYKFFCNRYEKYNSIKIKFSLFYFCKLKLFVEKNYQNFQLSEFEKLYILKLL